jgi:hypothetical protein
LLKHEASLGNALLRVKGLDAKLRANTKALEEAQTHLAASEAKHKEEVLAAKQAASHAIKEAEARAATTEDALAKIGQEQSKHEETAAERLNPLSTSFGSKCFLPLILCFSLCINVMTLIFHDAIEQIGEIFKLHEDKAEDPLFDAIEVLESNCKNARNVLQCTRHVLTPLFKEFFPKKKKEMPRVLGKLVEAFETNGDPTLLLKRSSTKRGTEVIIALAMSDWRC